MLEWATPTPVVSILWRSAAHLAGPRPAAPGPRTCRAPSAPCPAPRRPGCPPAAPRAVAARRRRPEHAEEVVRFRRISTGRYGTVCEHVRAGSGQIARCQWTCFSIDVKVSSHTHSRARTPSRACRARSAASRLFRCSSSRSALKFCQYCSSQNCKRARSVRDAADVEPYNWAENGRRSAADAWAHD